MLAWMDLEMTGLDVAHDVILEVATIVTDDDLNVVAEGPDLVVHQDRTVLDGMEKVVRDMHDHSGLTQAVLASPVTLDQAGEATLNFLREHIPQAHRAPLCGNSIGMDRRFLAAYLPRIDDYLHYRNIDVSTLKELARRWYPDIQSAAPKKTSTHRAMDDIRESIAELRYYREKLFVQSR